MYLQRESESAQGTGINSTKGRKKAVQSDTPGVRIEKKSENDTMLNNDLKRKMIRLSKSPSIKIEKEESDSKAIADAFVGSNPMATLRRANIDQGGSAGKVTNQLNKIKGLICEYPLDFLKDDFTSLKTTMIPSEIFK